MTKQSGDGLTRVDELFTEAEELRKWASMSREQGVKAFGLAGLTFLGSAAIGGFMAFTGNFDPLLVGGLLTTVAVGIREAGFGADEFLLAHTFEQTAGASVEEARAIITAQG